MAPDLNAKKAKKARRILVLRKDWGLDLNLDLDHDLNHSPHTFRSALARINPINIHKSSNLEKLKKSKIKIMIKIEIKI